MGFIVALWDLIRDVAVLAAAVGVANWAFEYYRDGPRRRDAEARATLEAERARIDRREQLNRLVALAQEAVALLRDGTSRQQGLEARELVKAEIHRVMHQTREPYLTFGEIKVRCQSTQPATQPAPAPAAGAAIGIASGEQNPVSETELRRAVIELVADGVLTQIESDKYFIASDFEDDDEAGRGPGAHGG